MKKTLVFTNLYKWLISTEMFARPSRQLPGRWRLFEYYSEPGEELENLKENHLAKEGYFWELNFETVGQLHQRMNLPVPFFTKSSVCSWQVARNFLKIYPLETPETGEEFQFAISKGNLKLLQKDNKGKIKFFGFFKRIEVPV